MPNQQNPNQPILAPDESIAGQTNPASAAPSQAEIRRHERLEISLPARLIPSGAEPGSRAELRFSGKAAVGSGGLEVTAVDLSDGGIGFLSPVMLPRNAVFQVRVLAPPGAITTSLIETRVRVRRCQMADHTPTFLIGTAFVEQSSIVRTKVSRARGILSITGPDDITLNDTLADSRLGDTRLSNSTLHGTRRDKGAA